MTIAITFPSYTYTYWHGCEGNFTDFHLEFSTVRVLTQRSKEPNFQVCPFNDTWRLGNYHQPDLLLAGSGARFHFLPCLHVCTLRSCFLGSKGGWVLGRSHPLCVPVWGSGRRFHEVTWGVSMCGMCRWYLIAFMYKLIGSYKVGKLLWQ